MLVKIPGGFTDGVIALAPNAILQEKQIEAFGPGLPLIIYLAIFVFDFATTEALPYRRAYYEEKEAEEEATEPADEPSE